MSTSPTYILFIRVPFPRGDFVDPPPVEWDAAKERSLWKVLSKASKNSDIDWKALASKFDVTEAFILQQAAWLYERQLSEVRAQMRKVGVSKSSAPSPVPLETPGAEAMKRTSSGGGKERTHSSLSARKESIPLVVSPSTPRTAVPPIPRTNSGNSVQSRILHPPSPRSTKPATNRRSLSPPPRGGQTPLVAERHSPLPPRPAESSSPMVDDDSSSSESDSSDDLPVQSRILRRPTRFQSHKQDDSKSTSSADDSPAFLPFTSIEGQTSTSTPTHQDPSATLRGDPRQMSSRRTAPKQTSELSSQHEQTSDSSASSVHPRSTSTASGHGFEFDRRGGHRHRHAAGPLSPRRTAELSRRSPGKAGSDGTPSMGSSFSDLDDASVTQSALEEALASNMNAGTMASRMSSISHALRSRYL